MAAETIREFLVSLGFKVDQPTLKKFEESITGATFKAGVLAQAFVGMAKAIASSLYDAVKDLDNLYYTSVRVGSSATNLKALTQASQDFGVSAEEAVGNIEKLSELLNTNPGKEAFINGLGVKTRDANGALRDTVEIANELGAALAQRPDYMANQLADVVGLTYKFQRMIRDPGWLGDLQKHQQLLKDGGYEDAARGAALLNQQFRELDDRWDSLKKRFEVKIFTPIVGGLEELSNWLDAHGPGVQVFFVNVARDVERMWKVASAVAGAINWRKLIGVDEFNELFNGIERFSDWLEKKFPTTKWANGAQDWLLGKLGIKDAIDKAMREPLTTGARGPTAGGPLGVTLHNPGNLEYAGQPGAVRAGGGPRERRFAAFRTDEEGLLAMGRQLELDFHRGRDTINALIEKYAPPGENDTAAYKAAVAAQMHIGGGARLNLNDPAQLENLMNAMITHEQMENPYRPELVRNAASAAARGTTNVTLNSTINIDGSKDVSATKRAVNEALTDTFRKATRNLQPTTQ